MRRTGRKILNDQARSRPRRADQAGHHPQQRLPDRPRRAPARRPAARRAARGCASTARSARAARSRSGARRVPSAASSSDERMDLRLGADVDAAGRLVEHQHAAARRQPLREHELLLVAARQAGGHGVEIGRAHAQPREVRRPRARARRRRGSSQRATAGAASAASCSRAPHRSAPAPGACDPRARGRRPARIASRGRAQAERVARRPRRRPCASGSSPKMACAISERPAPTRPAKPTHLAGAHA